MRIVKPIIFNSFSFERDTGAHYYDENGILQFAAVDELRLGYDPTTLEYIGAIFESEMTNKILHSADFLDAEWVTADSISITANAAISPDGTANASLFAGNGSIRQSFTGLSGDNVFSVYVKPVSTSPYPSGSSIILSLGTGTGLQINYYFYSDHEPTLSYGAGSPVGGVKELPNGWFRIYIAKSGMTTASTIIATNALYDFYVDKSQFEAGALTPTSYFPSVATSGVRAADVQSSPPSIISSNVPEDDNPEYAPATPYDFAQEVMVLGDHNRNYRSLVAGTGTNTGNFPPDNPDKWLDIGAINRWRMFDVNVGADLQTENTGSVDVMLSLSGRINTIALFNLVGVTATVKMFYAEELIYEQEINLIETMSSPGWWEFYFEDKRQIKNVAFTNMPLAQPTTVQIIVDGGGGDAAIGKAAVGYGRDLGFAEFGTTSVGIIDYSTKEADGFGNYRIQERRFVDTMDLRVVVDPGRESLAKAKLSEARATPSVYIGEDGYESLIIFGFFRDFSVLFSTPASSFCSMRIEGI